MEMLNYHTVAFWFNTKHIVCGRAFIFELKWIIHYIITGCLLGACIYSVIKATSVKYVWF